MTDDPLAARIAHIRGIYRDMDAAAGVFQKSSGLNCLGNCGHCCTNPAIEATEAEMLPLAAALLEAGTAEGFYEKARQQDYKGRCIFFRPELEAGDPGHCGIYEFRPAVCRLFSASGQRDKAGQVRLVICGPLKKARSSAWERAQVEARQAELMPPLMSEYMMRLMGVDGDVACRRLPLNMAFRRAVERVSCTADWRGDRGSRVSTDNGESYAV